MRGLRLVVAGVAILVAWSLVDTLAHRWLLEPLYASSASLWRPPAEMSTPSIVTATLLLVVVFVATYAGFVRPKTFAAALGFGGLLGVALGTSSGLGTYIHLPIPLALAWGWFILGTVKGVAAGVLLGALVTEERRAQTP